MTPTARRLLTEQMNRLKGELSLASTGIDDATRILESWREKYADITAQIDEVRRDLSQKEG